MRTIFYFQIASIFPPLPLPFLYFPFSSHSSPLPSSPHNYPFLHFTLLPSPFLPPLFSLSSPTISIPSSLLPHSSLHYYPSLFLFSLYPLVYFPTPPLVSHNFIYFPSPNFRYFDSSYLPPLLIHPLFSFSFTSTHYSSSPPFISSTCSSLFPPLPQFPYFPSPHFSSL